MLVMMLFAAADDDVADQLIRGRQGNGVMEISRLGLMTADHADFIFYIKTRR